MKKLTTIILALAAAITASAQIQPKADPGNYTYEPQTDTTFTIEADRATYTVLMNGYSELDLLTDTYGAYLMFTPHNTGFSGHYTCSADETIANPGEFLYSEGVHDGAIFQTFVAVVNNGYFNITDYNVYFITDGHFDLDYSAKNIEVTGQLTTYWGSTINFHYSGPTPPEMTETAIDNTSAPSLRTYTDGRMLHLENAGAYDLLTIDGKTLYHGTNPQILLPAPGIYLVRTATETRKISVR